MEQRQIWFSSIFIKQIFIFIMYETVLADILYVHFFPVGWTVKSKTTFNKISPVTILGHSYLLNSEGNL